MPIDLREPLEAHRAVEAGRTKRDVTLLLIIIRAPVLGVIEICIEAV